jgi:hypothetical protein
MILGCYSWLILKPFLKSLFRGLINGGNLGLVLALGLDFCWLKGVHGQSGYIVNGQIARKLP